MSTYESEIAELKEWIFERCRINVEKRKNRPICGLDGNEDLARQEKADDMEFRRRLRQIREKYGRT